MEKGYNDASVRSIAKQAGLTTGAIFRYFADKESLFAALVSPVADHMLDLYRKGGERGFASLTDGHPEICGIFLMRLFPCWWSTFSQTRMLSTCLSASLPEAPTKALWISLLRKKKTDLYLSAGDDSPGLFVPSLDA